MHLRFLGTGGAWGLPEHGCPCAVCTHMRAIGESRTRTSLWLEGPAQLLIDPGPDIRAQLMRANLPRPDAVLITHEHGDHYLGLDELLCYRRAVLPEDWQPIPVYATAPAWAQIEPRFGYLLGSLLEKRLAAPGEPLEGEPFGPALQATPVKTDHGPMPKGSVGYRLEVEEGGRRVAWGYTSDMTAPLEAGAFAGLDTLVCQCHYLSEPQVNRANHLSLQNALPQIAAWRPGRVFLVHLSCQDTRPDDPEGNRMLKKHPPASPLADPWGEPYAVPWDQASWQALVKRAFTDRGLVMPVVVAHDGLRVDL